ncbi:hypothetical protein B005_2304 [Nocardiopsis alba ATCC BAA-2165]|uniref:Uncharacterized protein n=1 Tax=Nocardiopsis alba (strain ATCC BAA-2165 / BE74) TaxID=1205910 RepID=J7LB00_NOCAA|nr:hypothetical protein B005_2304 [Nocardiopsis alba ATCC BAA-2165]
MTWSDVPEDHPYAPDRAHRRSARQCAKARRGVPTSTPPRNLPGSTNGGRDRHTPAGCDGPGGHGRSGRGGRPVREENS